MIVKEQQQRTAKTVNKPFFKLILWEHAGYEHGTGTVNATVKIMDYLTLTGYYSREKKTFTGYVYNLHGLDVNYVSKYGNEKEYYVKVAGVTKFLNSLKGMKSEWSYFSNDTDYIITDFAEFAKNDVSFTVYQDEYIYNRKTGLQSVSEVKKALAEMLSEWDALPYQYGYKLVNRV